MDDGFQLTPIIEKLALHVGSSSGDDLPAIDAHKLAVDEVVNATGMLYPDARLLVRTWLATLASRHYDTIRLHLNWDGSPAFSNARRVSRSEP